MAQTDVNVRLRGDSTSYNVAVLRAKSANDAFTDSAAGIGKGLTAVNGPLNGVTARFEAMRSIVTGTAGAYVALGAGLTGVSALMLAGINEFEEYETHQLTTQQLLRATGYAAGLTSMDLEENARQVALATLDSVSGIQEAQDALLTFKSVSGDVFTNAIDLSTDLSVVIGGTAKSAAIQLGKALEDPTNGISSLTRVGVTFSESQKDVIRKMQETGRIADAQRLILKTLEDQVGGAARARAAGTAGAADTLGQAWQELLIKLGSLGPAEKAKNMMNDLANVLFSVADAIKPSIGSLTDEIDRLQKRLERGGGGRSGAAVKSGIVRQLEALNAELLLAKARKGDADSIRQMIDESVASLEKLESRLAETSAKKRVGTGSGRMSRSVANPEYQQLKTDIESEKAMLQELTALKLQVDAAANGPAAVAGSTEKKGPDAEKTLLGFTDAQIESGLASVRKAFSSERQLLDQSTQERQDYLDAALMSGKASSDEWQALTEQNLKSHQERLTEIEKEEAAKRAAAAKAEQELKEAAWSNYSELLTAGLEAAGKDRSMLYKAMFAAQKAAAIPSMITAVEEGSALAIGLGPAGLPLSFAMKALGYASIGAVMGQTIGAFANGGIVPGSSYSGDNLTANVNSGEMILNAAQQRQLWNVANNGTASSGAGVVININEDASRAGKSSVTQNPDGGYTAEVFVANLMGNGRERQALDSLYKKIS
jgi:hypothetical protein